MKRAIIIFTRLPLLGETKSRLRDFLPPLKIQALSYRLLCQNVKEAKRVKADRIFWVTSQSKAYQLKDFLILDQEKVYEQIDAGLGDRMAFAIEKALEDGYEQVLLIGSDLADLTAELMEEAFTALTKNDVVISPTADGGYGLIGMSSLYPEIFALKHYGGETVYQQVLKKASDLSLELGSIGLIHDVDTKEDLVRLLTNDPTATFLAQGEYNANFVLDKGRKIFRVALGSQMHLDHQIAYEYQALKLLEPSLVTPRVEGLYHDLNYTDLDYLIEEFLPGRPLDYQKDSLKAAHLLAKVHNVSVPKDHGLLEAKEPFAVMYDEFLTMFKHYQDWTGKDKKIEARIKALLEQLQNYDMNIGLKNPCIINTELNAGNFLINEDGPSYIIDWEKPIIGEREQDLAHFLAPTTTLWKTDYLYDKEAIEEFLEAYNAVSQFPVDRRKLEQYLKFTCLRGITWCAMAYVQYQEAEKLGLNEESFKVISSYLTDDFLKMIEHYFK